MKFKLSRQNLSPELKKIISREMRKQKINLLRPSIKNLKEIQQVTQSIKKKGLPDHLVCKKLKKNLGRGIFLRADAKPIEKGEVIAPYAGEVYLAPQNEPDQALYAFAPLSDIVLTRQEHALLDKKRAYHPRRLYSLQIDALKQGNFTRFVNHSDKPNVIAYIFTIPSNRYHVAPAPIEIVYVAKKKILPGEQLLICYEDGGEKSYWGVLKIKPFPITPQTIRVSASNRVVFNRG